MNFAHYHRFGVVLCTKPMDTIRCHTIHFLVNSGNDSKASYRNCGKRHSSTTQLLRFNCNICNKRDRAFTSKILNFILPAKLYGDEVHNRSSCSSTKTFWVYKTRMQPLISTSSAWESSVVYSFIDSVILHDTLPSLLIQYFSPFPGSSVVSCDIPSGSNGHIVCCTIIDRRYSLISWALASDSIHNSYVDYFLRTIVFL